MVRAFLLSCLAVILTAMPSFADPTEADDFGARALKGPTWSTTVVAPGDLTRTGPAYPVTPPVSNLYGEPTYYLDGCHVAARGVDIRPGCVYGDPQGERVVAVVGDSKIGRYFPALEEIARREGWLLRLYTKSACAFHLDPVPTYPACETYNQNLKAHLGRNVPDLVLTSSGVSDLQDSYVEAWTWLHGLGVDQVVALWDSPTPVPTPTDCIAGVLESGGDLWDCAMRLEDDRSGNRSLRGAADLLSFARFVDLRDWVCPASALSPSCPPVVGRAQLYGLGSHLTPTFTRSLTDPIHQRLFDLGVTAYRPSVDRVGGESRYETAALLSRDLPPGGRVFVAGSADYPDALAAAARAGNDRSPILLARVSSLPAETRRALERLAPREVVVVGGSESVGTEVAEQLREFAPKVVRVAGGDRYGTAAALSEAAPLPQGEVVYVARGDNFPDALAAAAVAGQQDGAILLVKQDRVPSATAAALTRIDPALVVVAGGEGAVSDTVLQKIRTLTTARVERRGGLDRYATAEALARDVPAGRGVHLASGSAFPDALAAGPVAAGRGGAVLLVQHDRVPLATRRALERLTPPQGVLVGGEGAVTEDARRTLIRIIR